MSHKPGEAGTAEKSLSGSACPSAAIKWVRDRFGNRGERSSAPGALAENSNFQSIDQNGSILSGSFKVWESIQAHDSNGGNVHVTRENFPCITLLVRSILKPHTFFALLSIRRAAP
jgi:hypothetical protein